MPVVWFVRHAESQANAGLPTSDPAQIPLTTRGFQQANCIADCIEQPPALIVVSPYLRTQQTAQPTMERFPAIESQIWQVQEFTYLSPARCQNTTVKDRRPMVEAYWEQADPEYVDGKGAESFSSLLNRVTRSIVRLEEYRDDFIVVFSHGQFMRALIWTLLIGSSEHVPQTMREFRTFALAITVPNGSIVKVRLGKTTWLSPVDAGHIPVEIST